MCGISAVVFEAELVLFNCPLEGSFSVDGFIPSQCRTVLGEKRVGSQDFV
jgi:hypothetical protein